MVDYIRPANDDFPERIHCSVTREGMLVVIVSIRLPYICFVVKFVPYGSSIYLMLFLIYMIFVLIVGLIST